jgi:hypothetical protein
MTAVISGTNGLLQSYDYQVLTTGFSYTFAAGTQTLVMNPAGTLATGTITMPASPADGMTITFSSSQQITALTLNGNTGQSINNAVTLLPAKTAVSYVYRATGTTWWPTQTVPGVLTNGLQLYRLNADLVGANATGAQSLFGVGVTLAASTVYEFEIEATLSKTAGTTSHTVSLGFGGTATLNNVAYGVYGVGGMTLNTVSSGVANVLVANTASATAFTSAQTNATNAVNFLIKGTVSINATGTFIPQYTLSAAPGGAYSTIASSYVKIYPIGASGSATNVGSWA